eukprot:9110970-Alexandrium_andersonii.AAC.1
MSASLVGSEMCIRDRCCILGPLAQVALGWPPGASSAAWAAKVVELGRVACSVFPPAPDGLLSVADARAVVQARQLLEHAGRPAIAEFTIDQTGQGRLFNVRQPVERWSGEVAAVIAVER